MTVFLKIKNRAQSTLAADITDVATSLAVASGGGAKFPSTFPFHITIDNEILNCTNRVTDTLTVERAAESTSAAAHSSGAIVSLNITAGLLDEITAAINLRIEKATLDANSILYAVTDDTPIPLAVAASRVVARLASGDIIAATAAEIATLLAGQFLVSSKVLGHTRNLESAAGDVSYTGYGFQPRGLYCFAAKSADVEQSHGICDTTVANALVMGYDKTDVGWGANISGFVHIRTHVADTYVLATVKSLDADGFTLTWTKTGSPTGNAYLHVLALR